MLRITAKNNPRVLTFRLEGRLEGPWVRELEQSRAFFFQLTGDPAASKLGALQALEGLRQQQSAGMAFLDVFWVCAVVSLALVVLVLLMKRSVADKGERISAE